MAQWGFKFNPATQYYYSKDDSKSSLHRQTRHNHIHVWHLFHHLVSQTLLKPDAIGLFFHVFEKLWYFVHNRYMISSHLELFLFIYFYFFIYFL